MGLVKKGFIKKGKALDVCVGTGKNAFFLVKNGFEVTGIDIWLQSIEYWAEIAEREFGSPDFLQHQIPTLPFEQEKFDFIYDLGSFHRILEIDRDPYISDIYRVLKKGGLYLLVVLSDMNGIAQNHFSKGEIESYFSNLYETKLILEDSAPEQNEETLYFYGFLLEKKMLAV